MITTLAGAGASEQPSSCETADQDDPVEVFGRPIRERCGR
jgi:hypothetical protein